MTTERRSRLLARPPEVLDETNTISEPLLVDSGKNGAVLCIKAVQSENAEEGFLVYVNLSWKKGDLLLVNQQKSPRFWVSADRLLTHINKHYPAYTTITVSPKGK